MFLVRVFLIAVVVYAWWVLTTSLVDFLVRTNWETHPIAVVIGWFFATWISSVFVSVGLKFDSAAK